jgi:hypothetical protein
VGSSVRSSLAARWLSDVLVPLVHAHAGSVSNVSFFPMNPTDENQEAAVTGQVQWMEQNKSMTFRPRRRKPQLLCK